MGSETVSLPWATVHVGATRLKIVDQSDIKVPFKFPYLGITLAFNGEIYNWRQLRFVLSNETPWLTKCDAEVVARAWRRWGPGMLDQFNGMFAIALVDEWEGQVFLARDRAGEKPLYFASHGGDLHFASEIKAFPFPLEEAVCPDIPVFEFDCLETTPFASVQTLLPGQQILLKSPRDLRNPKCESWWQPPREIDGTLSWERAVEETKALLEDAVRIRIPDEVNYGVLVSGGLDSALIQQVAQAQLGFCCTFPNENLDCLAGARNAAPGMEICPVTFDLEEALEALPRVAYHLDTPATWSALGHWFLARSMAGRKVKVAFSGEGADELFAGYSRYKALWWFQEARNDRILADYQSTLDILQGVDLQPLAALLDRSVDGSARSRAVSIVQRFALKSHLISDASRIEWHTTMQCLLRMADRMMSAHSIENRSPFLDHRLVALAFRIPPTVKMRDGIPKAILREVGVRLGMGREVAWNTQKRGLVVPWNQWRKASGERGKWDRSDFRRAMRQSWREAYSLR